MAKGLGLGSKWLVSFLSGPMQSPDLRVMARVWCQRMTKINYTRWSSLSVQLCTDEQNSPSETTQDSEEHLALFLSHRREWGEESDWSLEESFTQGGGLFVFSDLNRRGTRGSWYLSLGFWGVLQKSKRYQSWGDTPLSTLGIYTCTGTLP